MIRGLFTFALLLVLGGGGLAYVLGQGQPEIGRDLPPVPVASQDAVTFDEKVAGVIAAIDSAKTSGSARTVTVVFTEAELTSKAAEVAATLTGGFVPTEPVIHLRTGEIVLTGGVSIQGFSLKLAVVAIPVVVDGTMSFGIKEIQTGTLPLPDGIKKEIDAQIAKILSPETLGLPLQVTRIEVQPGRLVLEGIAKP
jgi:hypothetical protein